MSNLLFQNLAEDLKQVNSIITKEDLQKFDVTITGILTSSNLGITHCFLLWYSDTSGQHKKNHYNLNLMAKTFISQQRHQVAQFYS